MKLFKCGTCDKILEEKYVSKHPASKITWLNVKQARNHDKEEKIDQLSDDEEKKKEEESRKAEEHEKEKEEKLKKIKDFLRELDDDQLMAELEKIEAELDELQKEKDELASKRSKSASLETLGTEPYGDNGVSGDHIFTGLSTSKKQNYSVLLLEPFESVTHSGDRLLMRLGSTDSDSVSDTSGDELLKSLGSVD